MDIIIHETFSAKQPYSKWRRVGFMVSVRPALSPDRALREKILEKVKLTTLSIPGRHALFFVNCLFSFVLFVEYAVRVRNV